MGACACNNQQAEEEYFSYLWNNVHIKKLTAEQLIQNTLKLKSNSREEFFKDFEENILELNFKHEDLKFKSVTEYLIFNSLSMTSPFKATAVFFSLLVVSDWKCEKSFSDAFKRFIQFCSSKYADVTGIILDDKVLVKEFVSFYVYLVSAQTHKAFLQSHDDKHKDTFKKSQNDFAALYSQRNRDLFVESLFKYYEKNEFSFFSFAYENMKKLNHADVRRSLEEIERKNVSTKISK